MSVPRHFLRIAVTTCAATAALGTGPVAQADPQSSSLCPEGALTAVPAGRLQCRAGQWLPSHLFCFHKNLPFNYLQL